MKCSQLTSVEDLNLSLYYAYIMPERFMTERVILIKKKNIKSTFSISVHRLHHRLPRRKYQLWTRMTGESAHRRPPAPANHLTAGPSRRGHKSGCHDVGSTFARKRHESGDGNGGDGGGDEIYAPSSVCICLERKTNKRNKRRLFLGDFHDDAFFELFVVLEPPNSRDEDQTQDMRCE